MTSKKLTDESLIDEIRLRFDQNREAVSGLKILNRKLEQMNDKLQESEALKSQFLSNIRNEINNPLTAIMGLAGQCSNGDHDRALCLKTSRMIYAEAFNLDFQLQNIFLAAELEAGEAEPSYALVDVPAVVNGCLDKLGYRIAEKDLEVSSSVPELQFPTDALKLEVIVINLLANAVEFSPAGSRISVEVSQTAEESLKVLITDDGPGIKPEDQEAVFDRFRQLDSGVTKGHRGHGLGLSICWSLADLLDGTLDLDSQPEQGCRFALTLPRPDTDVQTQAKDSNLFLFDVVGEGDVEQF